MTPDELKQARRKLGLSTQKLAFALNMGKDGGRTVRRWERGDNQIPGPVEVAVRYMTERG